MPYAPGITDISGQLLAQGMQQRAQGIAGGLTNWLQGYEQTKQLKAQGIGRFSDLLANDPQFQQYITKVSSGEQPAPDSLVKAVKRFQTTGDVDVWDAGVLGTTSQAFVENKDRRMKEALAESNAALARAQTAKLAQETKQAQETSDYFKLLLRGEDVPVAPTDQAAAAPVPPPMARGVPAAAVDLARQPQPTAAPVSAPPVQALRAMQGPPAGQMQGAPTEKEAAIKLFLSTGKVPSSAQVTSEMRVLTNEYRKNLAAQSAYQSPAEATAAANQMNEQLPRGTVATIDQGTDGLWRIKTVPSSQKPREQLQQEQEDELRIKSSSKDIETDVAAGASSRRIAAPVARLTKLVSEEGLQTGNLESFKLAARGVGKAVGLPVDETKLAQGNEAVAYMGQLLLPIYAEQKGAISNREQALYQSMGPNMAKDPVANARLLKVIAARIETDKKLEQNATDFKSGDIDNRTYQKNRQRILRDFDSSIPDLTDIEDRMPVQATTQAAPVSPQTGTGQPLVGGKYKLISIKP